MIHPVRLDAEHRYLVPASSTGEIQVPGYSEICKDLGIAKDNPFYTEAGREEGVALHKWLNFLVKGAVPKTAPDTRIAGRVEGINKFIKDTKFRIAGGERPLYDPVNRFACMPDVWGHMGNWSWVIDAKRGAKMKMHRLQTAAQSIALKANGFRAQKRGSLYLRDGDYHLEEHFGVQDERRWMRIVETYHIKQEYI